MNNKTKIIKPIKDYKIQVIVKMWFDDVNGNTYHNVNFNYKNKNYNSGLTYGYEKQYKTTLKNMLIDNDIIFDHYKNDYYKLRDFIDANFTYTIINVSTEEELEKIDNFTQI
tara:strand:+ start:2144 stop:2479 length:336 start_codon:yes stop_codon:yes gene_type:complete